MIVAIGLLLGLYLLGEAIVQAGGLPLPGALVGLLLLFVVLCVRGRIPESLGRVGGVLLRHIMLLLIPAVAGVMVHTDLLRAEGLPFVAACLVGAAITLAVTAITLGRMLARADRKRR